MKNEPSVGDHGPSVPEIEVDELVAQRAGPHSPQPALELEHESRSVVICDPESDEDGPTPARGTQSPFSGAPLPGAAFMGPPGPSGASSAAEAPLQPTEPPSAPISAPTPSARPRQLEEYVRRREKTVVLDRKRSVPPAPLPRSSQRPVAVWGQHWHLLAVVAGICVLAFAVGGLLSYLSTRRLVTAPPAEPSAPPPPSSAVAEPALAAPVKLSDLPIEPASDASARESDPPVRLRGRGDFEH